MTFNQWYQELEQLAKDSNWPIADKVNYKDEYDNGETPDDALANEMSYADE